MKYAIDPITGEPVSPAAHELRKKGTEENRGHGKHAICSECKAEVFAHSVHSLQVMPHFNHTANSGPCRLKDQPIEEDISDETDNGADLRRNFFQADSIQFAFAACRKLVCGELYGHRYYKGNFPVSRFVELLKIADRRRTWALKGLTPKLMPFALVEGEIFRIRYGEADDKAKNVTFVYRKTADEVRRRLYNRNPMADPNREVFLEKHFVRSDGTPGGLVTKLDRLNPHSVNERHAVMLVEPGSRQLSMLHVNRILSEFTR